MIKISMTFFVVVRSKVVNDASCYLRNKQLTPSFSVSYFKGEVL